MRAGPTTHRPKPTQRARPAHVRDAGEQVPAEVRGVPGLARFTGEVVFAAKREGADCILGDAARLQYKVLLVLLLGPRTRDACNIYPCIPF